MIMARKKSDYRVIADIECPGFRGGQFEVKGKSGYCALKDAASESILGQGCTITLRPVHREKMPSQGTLFETRSAFETDDLPLPGGVSGPRARMMRSELLSGWDSPGPSAARGAMDLFRACPALKTRVKKYWSGY
jgi:hypothetical protein